MDAMDPGIVGVHGGILESPPYDATRLEARAEGQHPDAVPFLHTPLRLEVGQLVEHQAA